MDANGNQNKPLSDYQIKLSELRKEIERGLNSGDSNRSVRDIIASSQGLNR